MKKRVAQKFLDEMQLSSYQISPTLGFLPEPDPQTELPSWQHEYFRKLDQFRHNAPRYFGTTTFRTAIDNLSQYYVTQVEGSIGTLEVIQKQFQENPPVAKLARLTLATLIQAYVIGSPHETKVGNICPRIPAGIAKPMVFISEMLDVPPILSYQDYALVNWERVDKKSPVELGNLMVLQYLLGGLDESWFILVHVDIERRMGKVPTAIIQGLRGVKANDIHAVVTCLMEIKDGFAAMNTSFLRMPEYCSSEIFFERVRPYINGQKNNPALTSGVIYEGVYNEPQAFYGETGAQSSIIPTCAAALGIVYPTDWLSKYVHEMHAYMPKGHRAFIADVTELEKTFSIQKFVFKHHATHPFLVDLYYLVLDGGRKFLEQHAQYAGEYIFRHSAKSTPTNPHNVGTGGSDFVKTLARHAACWNGNTLDPKSPSFE